MKSTTILTTKQSSKQTAEKSLKDSEWEVISDDETNMTNSVDVEKDLKQINSQDDRNPINFQEEILPQSRHISNNSNQINYMTSASEVLILQTLRNLDKYPTRTKLCRLINEAVTSQVYEQGFDVIQASLCLQLQTLPGIMELINVKQTVSNAMKGISVKTSREEFIETLEARMNASFDRLKKDERDGLERLASRCSNNTFEEIWLRINEVINQKESLCDENYRLKTDNKSQKEETDTLKSLMEELKKVDLDASLKDAEELVKVLNKPKSASDQPPMQEISNHSPTKRGSGSGTDTDKKRVYNYSWQQHVQLQKTISQKLVPLTRTLSDKPDKKQKTKDQILRDKFIMKFGRLSTGYSPTQHFF